MFEPSFCKRCEKELTGVIEILSADTQQAERSTTDLNWQRCDSCKTTTCMDCAGDISRHCDRNCSERDLASEVTYGGF